MEGDTGIGTIVGSSVFNLLGIAAVCGLATGVVSNYCNTICWINHNFAILPFSHSHLNLTGGRSHEIFAGIYSQL